jgi:hypothetical protein
MKKLIFAIVVLMIFPLTVFSWTDTSGSTDTASVDYDTKDMLNNSYDRGNLKFRVEVDSGSLDNIGDIINIVATSDTVTHNKLDKQYVLISSLSTSPVNSGILYDVMRSSAWVQNFPTDYPDSTAQSSLNSIDTTATNIYNQLVSSPIMTVNQDYINKVSTGTAGKLIISGDIVLTIFMDAYSFYSVGGDSQITSTFTDGAMYALEGIPINFQKLSRPISNPTFQCTLATNTTLYYIMNGLK